MTKEKWKMTCFDLFYQGFIICSWIFSLCMIFLKCHFLYFTCHFLYSWILSLTSWISRATFSVPEFLYFWLFRAFFSVLEFQVSFFFFLVLNLKCRLFLFLDYSGSNQINRVINHPTLPISITAHEDRHIRFFDNNTGKQSLVSFPEFFFF